MDRSAYIGKRMRRKMARSLDDFDLNVAPWVPADKAEAFKRVIRRNFQELGADAVEVLELGEDTELNGVAVQIRDRTGAT